MVWRIALAGFALLFCTSVASAQYVEAAHLHGIHFYPESGSVTDPPARTDAEDLFADSGTGGAIAGDGGGWLLGVTVCDVSCTSAPFYQWPYQGGAFGPTDKTKQGYMTYSLRKATQGGKNHSPVVRIQPSYGINVPYDAAIGCPATDPYTVANFASDARAAATLMRDIAKYYVIGNEVNIAGENHRFRTVEGGLNLYDIPWQPTPEQYADTYMAVRDSMKLATAGSAGTPVALMQAVSPGDAIAGTRPYDGNEFLARMIRRVNSADANKVDGFALHGYAEPGGANYGLDGFMDAIKEQLCVTGQLGHAGKPVFITEYNKHMPDAANMLVAVNFVKQAHAALNAWNLGSGGLIPGVNNQNIRGTNWFVYDGPGWNDFSLKYWKGLTPSPTENNNIWYAFRYCAQQRYARGASGGGGAWPVAGEWWRDTFAGSTIRTGPGMPDWHATAESGGSVTQTPGMARLQGGTASATGNAFIQSRGYVFLDFALQAKFTMANAATNLGTASEANFDVRFREGSRGYSLTFFSSASSAAPGRVLLRRTNDWGTIIGGLDVAAPGGINTGDSFEVRVVADGANLNIKVYKNGSASPFVSQTVTDAGQTVGYVRMGVYGMREVDVTQAAMGGKQWDFNKAEVSPEEWMLY